MNTSPSPDGASAGQTQMIPIIWSDAEPARLARDLAEVGAFAPELQFRPPGETTEHGCWVGRLPKWPFDRVEPLGLDALLGPSGLSIELLYTAAYPMVPPAIYPLDPEPTFIERTQSAWHVAPSGSLCLLQSDGAWQPETSVVELLAKACGWRIEYALMKAGWIDRMTVSGIVSDDSLDALIGQAFTRPSPSEDPAEALHVPD